MGMTPQEIQEKHFHDTFRGYSHEEVDLFLDEVAVAFERLYRENQSFMRRVVDLEEQLKRVQEGTVAQPSRALETYEEDPGVTESTLKRMLLIAQETADRAVQEARQRAREIQEQARARADEMMEHAEKRVRELSAQRMEKEKELEKAKEALRRFDQQYRASFRVFIESQLEALRDLPASPPGSDIEAPGLVQAFEPRGELMGYEPNLSPNPPGMETVAMSMEPIDQAFSEEGGEAGPDSFDQALSTDEGSVFGEAGSEPSSLEWKDEERVDSADVEDDPELVRTPKSNPQGGTDMRKPADRDESDVQSGQSENRSRKESAGRQNAGPGDVNDVEEDRLIRELFWGEED